MSVGGIGTTMSSAWYETKKAERNAMSGTAGFMETIAEKTGQDNTTDYDEKAFASVGANAPEKVKQAWLEAAKEIGVNGLGMSGNGMLTHISQMMVQRLNNWMNGIGETNDILGSTVQSAIRATERALYNLEHPLAGQPAGNMENRKLIAMERAFYKSFLDKLVSAFWYPPMRMETTKYPK